VSVERGDLGAVDNQLVAGADPDYIAADHRFGQDLGVPAVADYQHQAASQQLQPGCLRLGAGAFPPPC
jgi:hypothetical protein